MALYDMIRNAQYVSLVDIVARQSVIGQYHLFIGKSEVEALRAAFMLRKAFITAFYSYVKEGGYATMSWTEWVKTHPTVQAAQA